MFSKLAKSVWIKFPSKRKHKIKGWLFKSFPVLFSRTSAYERWKNLNDSDDLDWNEHCDIEREKPDHKEYVEKLTYGSDVNSDVRTLAFYLPQFHCIKENDEWWGEGFTEWTNVKPAKPQYTGHYQPHKPDHLGYYSLDDTDTFRKQIELAKLYQVGGFCFYYYWFGGKRLLEKPIENYLSNPDLDHPFCLCWANENWSRRWDGQESHILIEQNHSEEDDIAFARDISRYMKDKRYIRVGGKPLLLVYRPSLLPNAKETVKRWRAVFREEGLGEVYIVYTQSFDVYNDPKEIGFDAAVEFPPNNSNPPNITDNIEGKSASFKGVVYDWNIFLERSKNYSQSPYKLFRSVCPSWDNTARRKNKGTVFEGSTPRKYQEWLENAIEDTVKNEPDPSKRLVFINAWNEWAEGAHLEPDQKYGYAWLEATRLAQTNEKVVKKQPILVVSHDAHPHGAQFLLLGIMRSLKLIQNYDVFCITLDGGKLVNEFEKYSTVYNLEGNLASIDRILEELKENSNLNTAILNTTVSGKAIDRIHAAGIKTVALIHEMPDVLKQMSLLESATSISKLANEVIFPAQRVKDGFESFIGSKDLCSKIIPQGVWRSNYHRFERTKIREELASTLSFNVEDPIFLTVGYMDKRKGADLFAKAAIQILTELPDAKFIWIGHWEESVKKEVDELVVGHESSFRFMGFQPETAIYHAASDVYLLTSREDPFPNVILESYDAGVPVIGFKGTGGGADLIEELTGDVVDLGDLEAYANLAVKSFLEGSKQHRDKLIQFIRDNYDFNEYVWKLTNLLGHEHPKVSVVVPNYNYGYCIKERLDSILVQDFPIWEIIIIDDCSKDNSREEIVSWLNERQCSAKIIFNSKNSGSAFNQWENGLNIATGDFVWIAEADDISHKDLLKLLVPELASKPNLGMSYCASQPIDINGNLIAADYNDYYSDIEESRWEQYYENDGKSELENYFFKKNPVLNVSSVVFRTDAIKNAFHRIGDDLSKFRYAGDWFVYINILLNYDISYCPITMNKHRRHSESITGDGCMKDLVVEIESIYKYLDTEVHISDAHKLGQTSYIDSLIKQ
ncbi:glycoside hydrolase family 99-like domain-containing protein [Vibrio kanaloae]|uniref:glycoside hydrolase family 99-like domain-containing protein n=1 Tax=Vibrio kanaloae TaxID=170673 RepID=UPI001EFC614E|nr:glycoside hydrolase family 99-like domain-containing protein [Vibrio kanaloae]MCG9555985.1 glycoside hydrolase family 99-like domain-containing protein [Vibrio kanaloae]